VATISTSQDLDFAARAAGEAFTVTTNAILTINTDTRWHKNAVWSLPCHTSSFSTTQKRRRRCGNTPLHWICAFFDFDWLTCDKRLEEIAKKLDQVRHYDLLRKGVSATLCPVDPRSFRAGLLGANRAGLFHGTL